MQVLILSNQALSDIHAQWKAEDEQARAEHLWGATVLNQYGIDVDILPYQKFRFLKFLSKLNLLGDLDQQLRVLLVSSNYDAIYSAHHLTTPLLAFLRKLGIFKTPIVAIAYQSLRPTLLGKAFTQWFVAGNDHIICLSQQLKDDFIDEFHLQPTNLSVAEWGTDLPFYPAIEPLPEVVAQPLILSIGKTYRDYSTLLKAIAPLNCQLKICCFATAGIQDTLELPPNASCYDGVLPWRAVLQEYRKAYAIAIPLADYPAKPKNAVGLTTLLEAMAMGKPVIMTRNDLSRYVIDIEAEGIGLWVKAGDTQGWETALKYLLDHPDVADAMGQKARQLAKQQMNLEVFSQKVATVLKRVHRSEA